MDALTGEERELLMRIAEGESFEGVAAGWGLDASQLRARWEELAFRLESVEPKDFETAVALLHHERSLRRRLEREAWAAEARLDALMDIAPEAILLVQGRTGEILQANNQAQIIFGYSAAELVGMSVEMLVPADQREIHVAYRKGFLSSVRKRALGYHPEIHALRRDGTTIELDIALTATPATDDVLVVCCPTGSNLRIRPEEAQAQN